MYSKGNSGCAAFSYMGLFSLTWLSLTYLTQRLEYRFHTARVIGSNPIVGKTGRNPCFCQHDSKHGLAARSQLNDQSIGCFHLRPSSTALLSASTKQVTPPLFFSSCMWAACPSRIDEQEQAEERRERESGVISKSFLFSYFKLYLYLFIFYIIYIIVFRIKLYVFLICCHSTTAGLSSAHS